MGCRSRDIGGEDKSGGTVRGKIVYAYSNEAGEVLTWFDQVLNTRRFSGHFNIRESSGADGCPTFLVGPQHIQVGEDADEGM